MKNIEVDGVSYTVREIKVGEMMPILPRLNSDDDALQAQAQKDMVAACVSPLNDIDELPFSTYMALTNVVLEVNGLGNDK